MKQLAVHPLVDDYLRSLDLAARGIPRRDRDELLAEIRSHIDAALPADASEADVRNVLDQLGPPQDIVAAARPNAPVVRRGAREVFALVLLVSGFPPVIGWLVGLGLLLWSPLWSARQKLLGALVWPGGMLTLLGVLAVVPAGTSHGTCYTTSAGAAATVCTSSSGPSVWIWPALAVFVIAPLVMAGYLYREAGRRSTP